MATDDEPKASADEGRAWLDGLAGRGGSDAESKDAARLTQALARSEAQDAAAQATAPAWDELVRRAQGPEAKATSAANDPGWMRWGWAVAAVLVLGLVLWARPGTDDTAPMLRGGATKTSPRWLVAEPRTAARELADRLIAQGAHVVLADDGEAVVLRVQADAGRAPAVDRELAPIETALDPTGRLELRIEPRR